MPALPDVAKVLKVVLRFLDTAAKIAIVTDHVKYSGTAPTATDLSSFNTATANAYANHLKALTSDKWQLTEVTSTDLTSPSAAQSIDGFSVQGTASGFLPADACAVISQFINRRYRGGHAKQFWPLGVQSNLQDPNEWNTTFLSALNTAYASYRTDMFAGVWSGGGVISPVMVSYYEGFTNVTYPTGRIRAVPTRRATPLVDDVMNEAPRVTIGSQRRRQSTGA